MNPETRAHDHLFLGHAHDANARRTLWVVALTSIMMVGEIVAGVSFNSMALLADGLHMATHAGALAIAVAAYAIAKRHARNRRFSFGTGKVGDLAGFASALILGVIAIGIAIESVQRLVEPRPVAFSEATVVAAIGLVVNIASALLLSGGDVHTGGEPHDHSGHRHAHRDHNLRAAFVHVLADALTSVLAIAALVAGRFLGWIWLDPLMGIIGAVVISAWSWTLMRDTAAVLLDTTEPGLEAEVRTRLETHADVRIDDLHVWRVGPGAHALILSVSGSMDVRSLRSHLAAIPGLAHVTVETS